MSRYILRRLLSAVPVIVLVAVIVFLAVKLAPGDPVLVMVGADARPEVVEAMRRELGLDQPVHVQFLSWAGRALTGDLGRSLFLDRPVTTAIAERLEPTVLLTFGAVAVAILIGVPAGVFSALRKGGLVDQFFMFVALSGVSIPEFWLALNLVVIFGVDLGWLPVAGYVPIAEGGVAGALRFLVMPAFAVGFIQSALIARMTRASMIDVLSQDYIRTARAKGLGAFTVVAKHAFRNVLIAVVTVVGLVFALALGGAIVVETVFNIPGIGRLLVESVLRRDYTVIQGVVLYTAVAYVLFNLLVDVLYVYIDPRVRYEA
jgi:peptide/nickel transport system permease protein